MEQVRIAVIGTGWMARQHMEKIADFEHACVGAVSDINQEVVDQLAKQYACPGYTDHKQLLSDGVADAVLIATPHFFHTSIGIDALEAKHHVLVEKPISAHKSDCEKLIAAHSDKDLVFGAMFNQRTDTMYKKLRQVLQSGDAGEITRMQWTITDWFRSDTYYKNGDWRATWAGEGGGALLNQCPHQLDMMIWLCGMPKKVHAFCRFGQYHDIEVEDDVTAYIEFENGASGVFITTTGESPGSNRLEINTTRGKLVAENEKLSFDRTEVPVPEFARTSPERMDHPPAWHCTLPTSGPGGQHREIMENFVDAIRGKAELIAPAAEGIWSVELANAMLYSAWTGQTVELPLDGVAYAALLEEKISGSRYKRD
jgi:predicted dehydrogenase